MRIAMIGQKGIPAHSGGVEQHVEILARLLAERGHHVDVYCRSSYVNGHNGAAQTRDWHHPRVQQIVRWCIGTKHLDAISNTALCTLDALCRDSDLIHYHALGPASLSFVPRLVGRPVVVTVHGLDWQRAKWGRAAKAYLQFGEKVAARAASEVVVVSKPLQDYFLRHYGRRTVFIPNGVREIVPGQNGALTRWGLEPGKFLLCVARLVAEKGQHYLVDAFRKMTARGAYPDWRLVIVGGSDLNSDYESRVREMAGPGVVFTGAVGPDVLAELYGHAYLFVLPSEIEGMSLALLEALSCGLPALVSDIPENAMVVAAPGGEDGGFTFRCGDVPDLVKQMSTLVSQPERVRHAGCAARRVVSAYRWPKVAAALEQTYRQALSTRS